MPFNDIDVLKRLITDKANPLGIKHSEIAPQAEVLFEAEQKEKEKKEKEKATSTPAATTPAAKQRPPSAGKTTKAEAMPIAPPPPSTPEQVLHNKICGHSESIADFTFEQIKIKLQNNIPSLKESIRAESAARIIFNEIQFERIYQRIQDQVKEVKSEEKDSAEKKKTAAEKTHEQRLAALSKVILDNKEKIINRIQHLELTPEQVTAYLKTIALLMGEKPLIVWEPACEALYALGLDHLTADIVAQLPENFHTAFKLNYFKRVGNTIEAKSAFDYYVRSIDEATSPTKLRLDSGFIKADVIKKHSLTNTNIAAYIDILKDKQSEPIKIAEALVALGLDHYERELSSHFQGILIKHLSAAKKTIAGRASYQHPRKPWSPPPEHKEDKEHKETPAKEKKLDEKKLFNLIANILAKAMETRKLADKAKYRTDKEQLLKSYIGTLEQHYASVCALAWEISDFPDKEKNYNHKQIREALEKLSSPGAIQLRTAMDEINKYISEVNQLLASATVKAKKTAEVKSKEATEEKTQKAAVEKLALLSKQSQQIYSEFLSLIENEGIESKGLGMKISALRENERKANSIADDAFNSHDINELNKISELGRIASSHLRGISKTADDAEKFLLQLRASKPPKDPAMLSGTAEPKSSDEKEPSEEKDDKVFDDALFLKGTCVEWLEFHSKRSEQFLTAIRSRHTELDDSSTDLLKELQDFEKNIIEIISKIEDFKSSAEAKIMQAFEVSADKLKHKSKDELAQSAHTYFEKIKNNLNEAQTILAAVQKTRTEEAEKKANAEEAKEAEAPPATTPTGTTASESKDNTPPLTVSDTKEKKGDEDKIQLVTNMLAALIKAIKKNEANAKNYLTSAEESKNVDAIEQQIQRILIQYERVKAGIEILLEDEPKEFLQLITSGDPSKLEPLKSVADRFETQRTQINTILVEIYKSYQAAQAHLEQVKRELAEAKVKEAAELANFSKVFEEKKKATVLQKTQVSFDQLITELKQLERNATRAGKQAETKPFDEKHIETQVNALQEILQTAKAKFSEAPFSSGTLTATPGSAPEFKPAPEPTFPDKDTKVGEINDSLSTIFNALQATKTLQVEAAKENEIVRELTARLSALQAINKNAKAQRVAAKGIQDPDVISDHLHNIETHKGEADRAMENLKHGRYKSPTFEIKSENPAVIKQAELINAEIQAIHQAHADVSEHLQTYLELRKVAEKTFGSAIEQLKEHAKQAEEAHLRAKNKESELKTATPPPESKRIKAELDKIGGLLFEAIRDTGPLGKYGIINDNKTRAASSFSLKTDPITKTSVGLANTVNTHLQAIFESYKNTDILLQQALAKEKADAEAKAKEDAQRVAAAREAEEKAAAEEKNVEAAIARLTEATNKLAEIAKKATAALESAQTGPKGPEPTISDAAKLAHIKQELDKAQSLYFGAEESVTKVNSTFLASYGTINASYQYQLNPSPAYLITPLTSHAAKITEHIQTVSNAFKRISELHTAAVDKARTESELKAAEEAKAQAAGTAAKEAEEKAKAILTAAADELASIAGQAKKAEKAATTPIEITPGVSPAVTKVAHLNEQLTTINRLIEQIAPEKAIIKPILDYTNETKGTPPSYSLKTPNPNFDSLIASINQSVKDIYKAQKSTQLLFDAAKTAAEVKDEKSDKNEATVALEALAQEIKRAAELAAANLASARKLVEQKDSEKTQKINRYKDAIEGARCLEVIKTAFLHASTYATFDPTTLTMALKEPGKTASPESIAAVNAQLKIVADALAGINEFLKPETPKPAPAAPPAEEKIDETILKEILEELKKYASEIKLTSQKCLALPAPANLGNLLRSMETTFLAGMALAKDTPGLGEFKTPGAIFSNANFEFYDETTQEKKLANGYLKSMLSDFRAVKHLLQAQDEKERKEDKLPNVAPDSQFDAEFVLKYFSEEKLAPTCAIRLKALNDLLDTLENAAKPTEKLDRTITLLAMKERDFFKSVEHTATTLTPAKIKANFDEIKHIGPDVKADLDKLNEQYTILKLRMKEFQTDDIDYLAEARLLQGRPPQPAPALQDLLDSMPETQSKKLLSTLNKLNKIEDMLDKKLEKATRAQKLFEKIEIQKDKAITKAGGKHKDDVQLRADDAKTTVELLDFNIGTISSYVATIKTRHEHGPAAPITPGTPSSPLVPAVVVKPNKQKKVYITPGNLSKTSVHTTEADNVFVPGNKSYTVITAGAIPTKVNAASGKIEEAESAVAIQFTRDDLDRNKIFLNALTQRGLLSDEEKAPFARLLNPLDADGIQRFFASFTGYPVTADNLEAFLTKKANLNECGPFSSKWSIGFSGPVKASTVARKLFQLYDQSYKNHFNEHVDLCKSALDKTLSLRTESLGFGLSGHSEESILMFKTVCEAMKLLAKDGPVIIKGKEFTADDFRYNETHGKPSEKEVQKVLEHLVTKYYPEKYYFITDPKQREHVKQYVTGGQRAGLVNAVNRETRERAATRKSTHDEVERANTKFSKIDQAYVKARANISLDDKDQPDDSPRTPPDSPRSPDGKDNGSLSPRSRG